MEVERFEKLVAAAVASLPEEFRELMDNVDVVVQDLPSPWQSRHVRRGSVVLGLYEGVPRTRRTLGYNLVVPDKITVFQTPLEAMYTSETELEAAICEVVIHEVAHHFGLDDEQLAEIEKIKRKKHGRIL
ncbi:MAG: metallopeptidase family protein [Dehalococcoidia bacterium]|nr:metallopeptidase family protein [Dehalococcoidia bacterium]